MRRCYPPTVRGTRNSCGTNSGRAGAITGAVVGGPVGAVVGAGVGGTMGAAAADANRPRVYVAPAVRERACVDHADGTRVCEEIRR